MYGPLFVAIILAPIFLILLFFSIFSYKIYEHYKTKVSYVDPKKGNLTYFYNMNYEIEHLEEAGQKELLIKLQKNYKKKKFWDKMDDCKSIFAFIAGIIGVILLVFLLVSMFNSLHIHAELTTWEEFATIAEETLASATNDIQEAGVVNKILEYNEWLAKARASQRLYGNWSSYWNVELPEPILLK